MYTQVKLCVYSSKICVYIISKTVCIFRWSPIIQVAAERIGAEAERCPQESLFRILRSVYIMNDKSLSIWNYARDSTFIISRSGTRGALTANGCKNRNMQSKERWGESDRSLNNGEKRNGSKRLIDDKYSFPNGSLGIGIVFTDSIVNYMNAFLLEFERDEGAIWFGSSLLKACVTVGYDRRVISCRLSFVWGESVGFVTDLIQSLERSTHILDDGTREIQVW